LGVYSDHVLPRAIDLVLGLRPYRELRAERLAGVEGRVLEIGFGSGLNLPHLAAQGGVSELFAVDPALTGRTLARDRIARCGFPVHFVGLDAGRIEMESSSVDCVLSTFTLCTLPDVRAGLDEVRRVLRPGGRLWFLEHGRARDAGVARWQARLNPLQRRLAGGCHLDRPIDALIRAAGFELERLETFYGVGPRWIGSTYAGSARPA
jgi:SAM-dependent methyltransferase